jgi:hypothetical protein
VGLLFRYAPGRKVRFCQRAAVVTATVLTALLVAAPAYALSLFPSGAHAAPGARQALADDAGTASAPSMSSPPTGQVAPADNSRSVAAPAQSSTDPAASAQPSPPPPPPPAPCAPGQTVRWACIDLSSGQAWLMNGENVQYGPVKIRPGSGEIEPRTGQPKATPVGRHRVQWKHKEHLSGEYPNPQHPERGAYMPYAVFFADGGIAIHGAANLSNPSAGCVKIQMPYTPAGEPNYDAPSDPRTFYEYLQAVDGGDEVQVVKT